MSIFTEFARIYPVISDEAARWERERGLIVGRMSVAGAGRGRVLDMACGQGFHARHLAREGFAVTGIDVSPELMAVGKEMAGGDKVVWAESDICRPFATGAFDGALLLGNTLALFSDFAAVGEVLRAASAALVDNGELLVHMIDFGTLKKRPRTITRRGVVDGRGVRVEKTIVATASGAEIVFEIEFDGRPAGVVRERLFAHGCDALTDAAATHGLMPVAVYGSFAGEEQRPGESGDVVSLYVKRS